MSRELEILAARKELLAARASLQRLRAAYEARMVREGLRLPRLLGAPMRLSGWVSLGLGFLRIVRSVFPRRRK